VLARKEEAVLALRGGRVLASDGWRATGVVLDAGLVAHLGDAPADALDVTGCVVVPGLVDLHVHASGGAPVQGDRGDLAAVASDLARRGTTSFLATAFAAPLPELTALVAAPRPTQGARCLGVHLEGPWVSPAAAGAQPPSALRPPSVEEALALVDAGGVRVVTVAPELPGALDLVAALAARGVHVSLGHSTASYAEALRALDAGARGVTHCFNAMSQLTGREPGLVGAALSDPRTVVEVIADGVHVHPASVLALVAARGPGSVALVSDCVDGCAPDGVLGRDGDVLRLPDGTLAGSALSLADAVRRCVSWGIPLEDAVAMASTTPASVLGVDASLRPGGPADLVVLDADLRVRHVVVAGELQ
jgi:N-acetylglucosamine-6-phosphate deacetylase